ncbi:MAG: glycosyltransferase family 9 protein [Nitrospirae bacterium]|nr:MAG: glycosyltransferase family 9 protein [Nitrospirota bacterium]
MAEPMIELPFTPRRILIVKPSSLGDVVHSLAILNVLRSCFPAAGIDWVIAKGLEGLLEGHPMIRRLIVIDKDRWRDLSRAFGTMKELRELSAALKEGKYDLVVDLQGLLRSGIMTRLTNAPVRVGFADAREGSSNFYTHKVMGGRHIHAVDRYLKIASSLGCVTGRVTFPFPDLKDDRQMADELKERYGAYAVLVPGARKPANRWPARCFGELSSRLPVQTLVVGSPGDRELAEEVVGHSGGTALSIAGKTDLRGLISVVKEALFMVSNDTGPMHIAAAFGVPVFALFGPADPVRTGPYGAGHHVIRSGAACAPCFKRNCENPHCMTDIPVDAVYEQITEFIRSRRDSEDRRP